MRPQPGEHMSHPVNRELFVILGVTNVHNQTSKEQGYRIIGLDDDENKLTVLVKKSKLFFNDDHWDIIEGPFTIERKDHDNVSYQISTFNQSSYVNSTGGVVNAIKAFTKEHENSDDFKNYVESGGFVHVSKLSESLLKLNATDMLEYLRIVLLDSEEPIVREDLSRQALSGRFDRVMADEDRLNIAQFHLDQFVKSIWGDELWFMGVSQTEPYCPSCCKAISFEDGLCNCNP